MRIFNFHFDGRKSGHENCKGIISAHEAKLGEDMGLANHVSYQARGYEKVFNVTLRYEDGYTFGPCLYGSKDYGDCVILEHVSSNEDHCFKVIAVTVKVVEKA